MQGNNALPGGGLAVWHQGSWGPGAWDALRDPLCSVRTWEAMVLVGISSPFSFTPMFPAAAPGHRQREGLIATGSCRAALNGAVRRVSPGASRDPD